MLIASIITTAALAGVLYSVHRDQVKLARSNQQMRKHLDRTLRRIAAAEILPDREGRFRLMIPLSFEGGMADGETQFVPLMHDEPEVRIHRVSDEGVTEESYLLQDRPDGTLAAVPSHS